MVIHVFICQDFLNEFVYRIGLGISVVHFFGFYFAVLLKYDFAISP